MPIRSIVASLIIVGLIGAGAVFIMGREQADFGEYVALLQKRAPNATLLCWIFGWAAATSAALAVLTGFIAFLAEEDDDGYRRRGFPKGVPAIFVVIALALFWAALACVGRAPERVIIPIDTTLATVEEGPAEEPMADVYETETEPLPVEPAPVIDAMSAAAEPRVMAVETGLVWEFKYPLVRGDEAFVYSPTMSEAIADLFPSGDPNGDVRAMLCGKAWVAFTGSASEEGPRDRNERRARRRAEMVAGAASDWLDAHDNCPRPVILAVTLGQHAATTVPLADAGRSTGYQRQTLVAFRDRAPGEQVDRAAAQREARAYFDAGENLELFGGRRYLSPPVVFSP